MPKFLKIPDFAKAGLNSDMMPWDLPGSFLTEISNVRINKGKLSPFGGSQVVATLPVDFNPGFLMHVTGLSNEFWLVAGEDAVYAYNGATFSDISNVAGYAGVSNPDLWSGCMMTIVPILNNPGHYPEYWSPQNIAQPMQFLPWDATQTWQDAGETAKIIRSHKQFLFALDLQSGAEEIPDGVRWSSPADNGYVPETWDPLDITNFAGLTRLGGEGGRIIDGYSLRDAFVVYRERSISVFDYVGGNFVWRIRNFTTNIGAIAPDSIIEVKGKHYLMGDADILVNDGNTIESLLHNRIKKRFSTDIDADNFLNSFAIRNNIASEIWFCVPRSGSVYPDLIYIYNWLDDTWAIRDMPSSPSANYGSKSSPNITWETIGGAWNTAPGAWGQRQTSPLDDTVICVTKPVGAGQSGELLTIERSATGQDTSFETNIERVGFPLEGLNNVTTITRVYPHMRGPGSVFIQIGSQDHPGSPVRWKEAVLFNVGTDRKIDVRTTGELHCFRIFKPESNIHWEISGMDIEYVMAGLR